MYCLQSRWKIEGRSLYYYGLRNKLFSNRVKISKKTARRPLRPAQGADRAGKAHSRQTARRAGRNGRKGAKDARVPLRSALLRRLLRQRLHPARSRIRRAGRCPMCRTAEKTQKLKSVLPLIDEIPRSEKSRFDIALFYTGGKDSAFMLYYLAKVRGLRVLALTWKSLHVRQRQSEHRRGEKGVSERRISLPHRQAGRPEKDLPQTPLSERQHLRLPLSRLRPVLSRSGRRARPLFAAGNEPVQMLGLYYNHIAPKIAYSFAENKFLTALFNVGRVLTLHPPLKQGQIQTLMTMKQLAYGDNPLKTLSGYKSELVSNVVEAIREVPELLPPLKRTIRASSRTGNVPAFIHLDLDKICGGKYDWNRVKDILVRECGWVPPADGKKALHTSCKIERCKDHSQFVAFIAARAKCSPSARWKSPSQAETAAGRKRKCCTKPNTCSAFLGRAARMRTHAGMGGIVIYVFYFSGRGHSRAAAEFLAAELGCTARDIADPIDAGKEHMRERLRGGRKRRFRRLSRLLSEYPRPRQSLFRGLKADTSCPSPHTGEFPTETCCGRRKSCFRASPRAGRTCPRNIPFYREKRPIFPSTPPRFCP